MKLLLEGLPSRPDVDAVKPLLRWAGGKQMLVRRLMAFCPPDYRQRRYVEPFLGAASLFLALDPSRALVGDANPHLISAYRQIRDNPFRVAKFLKSIAGEDSETTYYRIRHLYNRGKPSPLQAARFLYLNRTCFNGIFRVNTKGVFNVPYGRKENPWFPAYSDLDRMAVRLKRATIVSADYRTTLARAESGDFIYLDPPYPALNGTSYFAHYTMDRFGNDDQVKLASLVKELDRRGCLLMMSNADTPLVRELYSGFAFDSLDVTRYISCKAIRYRVKEVVVTNYRGHNNEKGRIR